MTRSYTLENWDGGQSTSYTHRSPLAAREPQPPDASSCTNPELSGPIRALNNINQFSVGVGRDDRQSEANGNRTISVGPILICPRFHLLKGYIQADTSVEESILSIIDGDGSPPGNSSTVSRFQSCCIFISQYSPNRLVLVKTSRIQSTRLTLSRSKMSSMKPYLLPSLGLRRVFCPPHVVWSPKFLLLHQLWRSKQHPHP